MPGHAYKDNELPSMKEDIKRLKNIITEHDTLFLLTDSRESRWLPAMLGAYYNKVYRLSAGNGHENNHLQYRLLVGHHLCARLQ